MNYYSEEIINKIIDESDVESLIEKIDEFKNNAKFLIQLYSRDFIYYKYADYALQDENVQIAFYCFDTTFNIYNCPVIMLYRKHYDIKTSELRYYILLICTKRKFRNLGYASILLTNFIQYIKDKNANNDKKIKIILSSIEEAVVFYENFGFRWTRESINKHKILLFYEKYDETKEYYILEYEITK